MDAERLLEKLNMILPLLNEQQKRKYLASEALYLGRGGRTKISKLTGTSMNTIANGIEEIQSQEV